MMVSPVTQCHSLCSGVGFLAFLAKPANWLNWLEGFVLFLALAHECGKYFLEYSQPYDWQS